MNVKRYEHYPHGMEAASRGDYVEYAGVKHLIKQEESYQQDTAYRQMLQREADKRKKKLYLSMLPRRV